MKLTQINREIKEIEKVITDNNKNNKIMIIIIIIILIFKKLTFFLSLPTSRSKTIIFNMIKMMSKKTLIIIKI